MATNAGIVLSESTVGPLFLGTIWNWTLLGSLVLQVCKVTLAAAFLAIFSLIDVLDSYAQVYHKHDRAGIKYLVYTIFVLEILFSIFLAHMNFEAIVSKWGDPNGYIFLAWSASTVTPGSGIMAGMVQIFFAWRIWMLNQHILARISTAVIILLAVLQASASVALTIWKTRYQLNTVLLAEVPILKKLTSIWLGGSFAVDVLIATVMVLSLVNSRNKTPIRRTENLINRLIVVTIETGVITAVTALLDLALYLLPTHGQTYHTAPASILGKLYSNVLMANLNGRGRSAAFKAGLQDSEAARAGMQLNPIGTAFEARGVTMSTEVHSDIMTGAANSDRHDLKTSPWDPDGRRLDLVKAAQQLASSAAAHRNAFYGDLQMWRLVLRPGDCP
ncbi:hypothetical protein B0H12DRAFT_1232559 [Mycena haematopus]|nr:hypothetical protein B0H12DRAFT_1232559 [Mycena haematopus]